MTTFDAPNAAQIVARVARFLEDEVYRNVPDSRINYRVKVAANLLRLAESELATDPAAVDADDRAATPEIIARYGGLTALAQALQSGERSIVEPEIFKNLSDYTRLRVAVATRKEQP